MVRTRSIAALVVLALAVTPVPALPSDPVTPEQENVAAIVFNLAMAVTWPEGSLSPSTFVIGIIGHDKADPVFGGLEGKEVLRRVFILRDPLPVAAAPEAQAFSTRVAGAQRRSLSACKAREEGKMSGTKPPFKWPSQMPPTSLAGTPACSKAWRLTPQIKASRSSPSSRPKFEWAQPTMHALIASPLPVIGRLNCRNCFRE